MPRRQKPQDTLQRAITLLRLIPKREPLTAADLCTKLASAGFPCGVRTMQRLLESLCDADHFDIERDASSKPYRYCLKEAAKGLHIGGLSAQECLLLTLAQRQLANLLPSKLLTAMDGFFAQARHQLNGSANGAHEREWLNKVRVVSTSQPLLPAKIDTGIFEQVSNALYGNYWLDVDYKNMDGKTGNYRVKPLGLIQRGPSMYLACQFEGHENYRSLVLHRMVTAKSSSFSFERPQDFSWDSLDEDMNFSAAPKKMLVLNFRINKSDGLHIVECPLSFDQQVVEHEECYEITATVADTDVLDRWLKGFGDAVMSITNRGL